MWVSISFMINERISRCRSVSTASPDEAVSGRTGFASLPGRHCMTIALNSIHETTRCALKWGGFLAASKICRTKNPPEIGSFVCNLCEHVGKEANRGEEGGGIHTPAVRESVESLLSVVGEGCASTSLND